jgi:hypothetical protein
MDSSFRWNEATRIAHRPGSLKLLPTYGPT